MKNLILIKSFFIFSLFSVFIVTTANAHDNSNEGPEVIPVMIKDLSDIPGKEALMITVNYKPGEVEIPHRHDAHCFLYVLDGEVIMGLKGGKEVKVKAGQTFYEGPNDIHIIGRNASKTKPAKFLVLLIKNRGVDAVLPVK
jgi:quercetin dioxygenase-like cupin family protein